MAVDPQVAESAGQITRLVTRGAVTLITDTLHGQFLRRLDGTTTVTEMAPLPPLGDLPGLSDDAPLGSALGSALLPAEAKEQIAAEAFPEGVFAGVVGLDYERSVLRMCVVGEAKHHALLFGPPGSAKSLLLEEMRSVPDSRFVVAQQMTPSGLIQLVGTEPRPKLLLIDELDKASMEAQGALLALMDGQIAPAMHGHIEELRVDVRVIAAANDPGKLIAPLLDRFIKLELRDYTVEERHQVITGFLAERDGMTAEEATAVADLVAPFSASVRDAERVAAARRDHPEVAAEMARRLQQQPAPRSRRR